MSRSELNIDELLLVAHSQNKTLSIETHNLFEVEGLFCVLASVTTDKGTFRDWATVRVTDPTNPVLMADALELAKTTATHSTLLLAVDMFEPDAESELVGGVEAEGELSVEEAETQFVSIPNIVSLEVTLPPPPYSTSAPPEETAGECSRCGEPITAYQTSASTTSAEQVATFTTRKWGAPHCAKCSKEKTKENFQVKEETV